MWYNVVQCCVSKCNVVWCSVVQCGAVWYNVVQCGAMWYGVMQRGAVWYSVVQCGAVGTVWCSVVQYNKASFAAAPLPCVNKCNVDCTFCSVQCLQQTQFIKYTLALILCYWRLE